MVRKIVPFGQDPVDELVAGFLRRKGIDPKDITGYRLSRGVDQVGILTVDLLYDNGPDMVDVTTLDKPPGSEFLPRVTTDNPNIVKEG